MLSLLNFFVRLCGQFFPFSIMIFTFVFFSCASKDHFNRLDNSVYDEKYYESIGFLESNKDILYMPSRDMVLYYLDKGMLSRYAGRYGESSELLQKGDLAIEEAFTKSISRGAGSFIINDNVLEYAGEDYEDIYVNAFNALNYYHQGDRERAMVEIRRMNNKLLYLETKYDTVRTDLQKHALADGVSSIPSNPNAPSVFYDSALARYLGMVFFRQDGRHDNARIDREHLLLAFANAPNLYKHPVPSSISGELEIPEGLARVNVIAFSGLSPIKESNTMRISLPESRWVKISLPEMVSRPSHVDHIVVQFDDGRNFRLELLEDIEAIARDTFKSRQNIIYIKTVIRAMLKGVSSSVFDIAAEQSEGTEALLWTILSLSSQLYAEASEHADLRIARYFPGKAWVGAVNVEPGIYSYRVNFFNRSGKLLSSQYFDGVNVNPGRLNLTEAFCLR